jgi:hypothetical protein
MVRSPALSGHVISISELFSAREECEVVWINRDYMYGDHLTKAQQGAEL